MRQPSISKWKISTDTEGLLFFALLVDELLFDYTIDTFKIPALNTKTICLELIHTMQEIANGSLKEANIQPIVQELCSSFEKDLVAKIILGKYHENFIKEIHSKQHSLAEIKVLIDFLLNRIGNIYFITCKNLLKEKLRVPAEKKDINRLTRIFLTELIDAGYSPSYIYFENDLFFFKGKYPKQIDSLNIIDDYFNLFKNEQITYNVLFRVNKTFLNIKDSLSKHGFSITESPPIFKTTRETPNVKEVLAARDAYPLYLIIKDIKAFDPLMAREAAESSITLFDSLFKYHIHREQLSWDEKSLVYPEDQSYFRVCKPPVSPTLKAPDEQVHRLNLLIDETAVVLFSKNLETNSKNRLMIALELHRAAIISPTIKNKILNFWAAIEVLFPAKEGVGKTRIQQIIENLIPFIVKAYVAKLSAYLLKSISTCGGTQGEKILEKIGYGDNLLDKCTAMFSIKGNESIRDELYTLFTKQQPLLKNRIYYLYEGYNSAEKISFNIKAHIERISWHIMRIYRTRNLIVHSGGALSYLPILVENLHSYLDRTLDVVLHYIHENRSINNISIEEIAILNKLDLQEHLTFLERNRAESCNQDNYKVLLYGS